MPALHPEVAPLAFLIGHWEGEGRGDYPTIEPFGYREEIVFAHAGKPFLAYTQRTWRSGSHPEAGLPLHAEAGYLRPGGAGRAELVVAQPTGIVEIDEGDVDGQTIHLRSSSVGRSPTAKEVRTIERRITVAGDELSYELWMEAVGQPHQFHLEATLLRRP